MQIMTQLEALNLTNCGLTDKTIATLLPAVCGIPGLLELYLRDNELYFEGAQHLFENFSELKKLKRLDIAHTFFDCALISENPGMFARCNQFLLCSFSQRVARECSAQESLY